MLGAMRRALALLSLAVPLACARDLGPEASYRALAKAVSDRDAERAWSLLTRASQKRLDERARAAAARAPGVVPATGRQLLLGDAALASRPVTSVVVLRESGDRAVLRVEVEGAAPREVTMVREGRWRVELPEVPDPGR